MCVCVCVCVCVVLSRSVLYYSFVTLWTVDRQAPLSMGFSRQQEYWNGLPFPSPGDLPKPGIELESSELQADYLPVESQNPSTKIMIIIMALKI